MKTNTWNKVCITARAGGKDGAILGMVLIIVLALSMVGLGLMYLGQVNAVEVSRHYNVSRAFWAAEAGLRHARARLLEDSAYRNQVGSFPQKLVNLNPELNYTGIVYYVASNSSFSIVSTGSVLNGVQCQTRIVSQSIKVLQDDAWPDAFNYALFGGTNDLYLKNSSAFNGSVFVNGDITYKTPLTMTNGAMYETITGEVSVIAGSGTPPELSPTTPVLDTTEFDSLISKVSSSSPVLTNVVSLGGGTQYVKSALFPPAGIVGSTGGADTLVIGGPVTINSGTPLTNKFRIIVGGDVTIARNLGSTATMFIYSSGNINFSKDVTVASNTMIFANQNITAEKALTFTGVMFANGSIDFKMDATITGSVVAAQGFVAGNSKLEKRFNITWSTNAFQFIDVLTNAFDKPPPVILVNPDWREYFQ